MQLTQLWKYPIKSCAGIECSSTSITSAGAAFDREWMVTDDSGLFLTGRMYPKLVLVSAVPTIDGLSLHAPGMPELVVRRVLFNRLRQTGVWAYRFDAWWGDKSADAWFSEYLGSTARLLYIGAHSNRALRVDPSIRFSFADGYPFLLIGEASLADLNSRLVHSVSMRNFRPNMVVDGTTAFAEDQWKRIRIGEVEFEHMKPCDRCVFTTIDPDTALPSVDMQPLRTLGTYRRTAAGVMFGQNLVARSTGVIRTGDRVEVVERAG
jgi:uncharacterized protein